MTIWMWPSDGELMLADGSFRHGYNYIFSDSFWIKQRDPTYLGWIYIGEL